MKTRKCTPNTARNASGFELHSGPILLIVEGGSADDDDEAYRAIRFEGGSEASGAGVAMEAEGTRRVDDRVPVRDDKYWWCCEFREKGTNGLLHCGGEIERDALFRLAVIGRMWRAMLGRNLR